MDRDVEVLAADEVEGVEIARRRVPLLRSRDVEPDDARVAPADRALRDLHGSRRLAHGRHEHLHDDRVAGLLGADRAEAEPLEVGVHDLVEGHATFGRELRGVADLGVHDAIRGEVLRALGRHPDDRVALLHHSDRVRERLEVQLEGLAVGTAADPRGELVGIAGRQPVVPELRGEVDDRGRPQPAVQVIVQQRLGRRDDGLAIGHVPFPRCVGSPGWYRGGTDRTGMMARMTVSVNGRDGGFDITLELERVELIPGRLVEGRVRVATTGEDAIRGARVTLVGTETYRYDQTTTDSKGHTRTETHTMTADLPHVPVALAGATVVAPGTPLDLPFQLPVPSLGPATFEATEFRVDWVVRAHLDVPGFDPDVEMPVRVLQPTSLLRAGVVEVGQFAQYPVAEVAVEDLRGSITLEPVPLCIGAPFRGRLELAAGARRSVQEVRLELRVKAEATVGGGRSEDITLWTETIAGEGEFGGEAGAFDFAGTLPDRCLPTVKGPHGRSSGAFHVVIATAWARDPHLIRDVVICSTTEL